VARSNLFGRVETERSGNIRTRRVIILLVFVLVISFSVGVLTGRVLRIQNDGISKFLGNTQVIAWVGVAVNFGVVFVAVFLNILHAWYLKPRFSITCGSSPPYQLEKPLQSPNGAFLLHVRLRVQNTGRSSVEGCEVRMENIYELRKGTRDLRAVARDDHDPRALKWVGRDTNPIALNRGAFDHVDLGARRSDFIENFRVEFSTRGHMDLNLSDPDITAFRLEGAVYGKGAKPKHFAFSLSWEVDGRSRTVTILET